MIKVKELIELLKEENQEAIVLVPGYEYGLEYFRTVLMERGKFKLLEESELNLDKHGNMIVGNLKSYEEYDLQSDGYGGNIEIDENGDSDFLLLNRFS